ncbi:MAG: DUF2935 domain-containing protein [Candidatus Onthomonas sp.]
MEQAQDYVVRSLELHLFFARIMKEHAFFLKVGFLPPGAALARESEQLLRQLEALLGRATSLSDHVVRRCVLDSGELFTEFTQRAECQTQKLTGTALDQTLTARVMALQGQGCGAGLCIPQGLACQVRQLNRDGLRLVDRLIRLKERTLAALNSCAMASANYPLLVEHILREARLYRAYLMALEGMDSCGCQTLRDSELFWNQIMMEHALFIRGLLDPSEEALIQTADSFASDYRRLLETAGAAQDRVICGGNSLALTRKFRDFKRSGVDGIEQCQIRSLILPLLADHVLREANHYIRLLEE